jgi:SAM-dependent methyltransferase
MLGQTLDYLILRPFSHQRNIRTEEELDSLASQEALLTMEAGSFRLEKLISRLEGNFPISDTLRYLDIGCGQGDIAVALGKAGCRDVTGIDFVPRKIAQATVNAQRLKVDDYVHFVCEDIHGWQPTHKYDVILSHEALEHISNPQAFLQTVANLLDPKGVLILAFGPLFHSPFGDHMNSFFLMQIPWRGVIFSEKAILRLRRERFRPTDTAKRYQEISGGLNLMRYSDFLRYVHSTGWEFSFLRVNPQIKQLPPLYYLSNALLQIPLMRDYVASSVYAVLRPRSSQAADRNR